MICDDHSLFSEAFASLLLQRGHDVVHCVATPAEALVAGRQLRPEVFLLDLHFPGVHGVDAVKLLRAAMADAPIVVLTAEPDAELLRQALDAGADGVVLKSEGVDEIEHVLRCVQPARAGAQRARPSADKTWSRQARALAQRQARIVEDRNLTPRERQVIVLLVQGKSTAAIAGIMNVGKATLHAHLQHLFVKLGVHSRLELVAYAIRRGIVHVDSYDWDVEPDPPQSAASPSSPSESAFERTTNTRRNMVQTAVGSDPSAATQWRA
ncbi:MAG TPA: response regulator transcription factor [Acidimicrobiales bacterium]|jgi:DNA-binding NarL/FixJ family response regulator|nr:response regulator transcription factor [Acidimicrobiales bacterium]